MGVPDGTPLDAVSLTRLIPGWLVLIKSRPGSDFLVDGGVTAAYFYGDLKPADAQALTQNTHLETGTT